MANTKYEKGCISADALMCCFVSLCWVRENIASEDSREVVHTLLKTLKENMDISFDTLLDNLRNFESCCGCRDLFFQYLPSDNKMLDKNVILPFLQELEHLEQLLVEGKNEQAYDLADAIHLLPEIILKNNGRIPKSYYKAYLEPYRQKWNVSM